MNVSTPPLAAVLGNPISHSRSPRLHGHWLRRYGINGYYIPVCLPLEGFADGVRALRQLGFRGANVTLPFKEEALALADSQTERAERIGAANTLIFDASGAVHADNTDGYGFIRNILQSEPDWRADAGPALVLGAGGAARAVIDALFDAGVPELRLANRTRARAEALSHSFGARVAVVDWAEAEGAMDGCMTLVNTTSLGMAGQPPMTLRMDAAPSGALVTDIVYTPLITPFLAAAQARGLRTVDGLGMLLHQAAPGFEAWFGRTPEVDDELRRVVLGE